MAGLKIVVLLIIVQLVNSKPLLFKEVHINKKFDLSITHPEFRPIEFIRTKIGHFINKHLIAKRDASDTGPVEKPDEAKTTFTLVLEKSVEAGAPPILPPPPPPPPEDIFAVTPLSLMFSPGPAVSVPPSSSPPPNLANEDLSRLPGLVIEETVVITPAPPPSPLGSVSTPILPHSELPPPDGPGGPLFAPAPPPPPPPEIPPGSLTHGYLLTPSPSPPPPPVITPTPILPPNPGPPSQASTGSQTQGTLLTNIGRVEEINSYLNAIQGIIPTPGQPPAGPLIEPAVPVVPVVGNSIEEPPKFIEKLRGPLVKGSRLALYFGNIFLQVMSEVISSARSAIGQYSQPGPISS